MGSQGSSPLSLRSMGSWIMQKATPDTKEGKAPLLHIVAGRRPATICVSTAYLLAFMLCSGMGPLFHTSTEPNDRHHLHMSQTKLNYLPLFESGLQSTPPPKVLFKLFLQCIKIPMQMHPPLQLGRSLLFTLFEIYSIEMNSSLCRYSA